MTRGYDPVLVNYHSPSFDAGFKQGLERKSRLDEPADPDISEIDWASYCEGWLMGWCEAPTTPTGPDPKRVRGDGAFVQTDSRVITDRLTDMAPWPPAQAMPSAFRRLARPRRGVGPHRTQVLLGQIRDHPIRAS